MSRLSISDVLIHVKKLPKNADKTAYLRANHSLPLFYVLWLAFSDKVEWLLPEGAPPYKPWGENKNGRQMRPGSEPTDLLNELRRLYIFLKDHPVAGPGGSHVVQLKREKIFQELLESLPADDVALLLSIKDKTFSKDYRFSRPLLDETFPGLLDADIKLHFAKR